MDANGIDAIRALLTSKPRPVGGGHGVGAWTKSDPFGRSRRT